MTSKPAFRELKIKPAPGSLMAELAAPSRQALSEEFTEAGFVKLLMSLNEQLEGHLENLLILLALTGDHAPILQLCFYWLAQSGYALLPYSELESMVTQKRQELCK